MKVRRRSLAKRQRSKSRKSKTRRSRFGGAVLSRRRSSPSSPRRRAASSFHTPSPPSPHRRRVDVMKVALGNLRPPSGSSPKSPSPWTRQYKRVKEARPGPSHSLS